MSGAWTSRTRSTLAPMPENIHNNWWPIKGAPEREWVEVCRVDGASVRLAFAVKVATRFSSISNGGDYDVGWNDVNGHLDWDPTHWRLPSGFPIETIDANQPRR